MMQAHFDVLFASSVALLIGAGAWYAITSWRRWRRLAALYPPTAEELEEVRDLSRPGAFQLSGRSSAVARHFEYSRRDDSGQSGGATGRYKPTFTEGWRDRRSDR